jgi:uncharacterized OB-fold protein
VRGFVDRVTEGIAVILLEGGGRAYVPLSELPHGLDAGSLVDVTFAPADSDARSGEALAEWIERLRSGEHEHRHHG